MYRFYVSEYCEVGSYFVFLGRAEVLHLVRTVLKPGYFILSRKEVATIRQRLVKKQRCHSVFAAAAVTPFRMVYCKLTLLRYR